jgi:streptogramin lyase
MLRKPLALAAALVAFALQAPSAHAAPALAGTFPTTGTLSGTPGRLAAGSDGNVWFVINSSTDNKQLGKITPSGAVTEYATPNNDSLIGITAGPDGNMWATTIGNVVKIPPGDPTTATEFADANILSQSEITSGPDGNLWAGSNTGVVKIPPGNPGGVHDTFFSGLFTGTALGITAGGDGNLWVANNTFDPNTSTIVRVSTSGVVQGTPTPAGNTLQQSELAPGPPGQVTFTEPIGGGVPERVGRVDYSGNVAFTDMPGGLGDPVGITFGNDGAYWIANFGADKVRRMTPAGDVTEPISFGANSGPRQITKGPNDTLWVSLETAQKIGKITGVSAPPPPVTVPPVVTPPTFTGLKPHGSFRVSGKSVTIPLACQSGLSSNCTGTITLRTASAVAAKKKRKVKIGSARFSIAPGKTGRVKVKLSKTSLKVLSKKHSLKAVATIAAKAGTASKTTTARITLKAAKRKK